MFYLIAPAASSPARSSPTLYSIAGKRSRDSVDISTTWQWRCEVLLVGIQLVLGVLFATLLANQVRALPG
jgi:hypothetical protein